MSPCPRIKIDGGDVGDLGSDPDNRSAQLLKAAECCSDECLPYAARALAWSDARQLDDADSVGSATAGDEPEHIAGSFGKYDAIGSPVLDAVRDPRSVQQIRFGS